MHRSHLVDRETDLWVCVRSAAGQEERQSDCFAAGDDDNCDDHDGDDCDGDDDEYDDGDDCDVEDGITDGCWWTRRLIFGF